MSKPIDDTNEHEEPITESEPTQPLDLGGSVDEDDAGDTDGPNQSAGKALLNRHLRYPNAYTWLLLMSAMDVMLTWIILHLEGREVNPVANWVLSRWALNGIIFYKFALILTFIGICEVVGSMRDSTGRTLSRVSVMIAMIPVVWSLFLLFRFSNPI